MATASLPCLECTICHEDFDQPKILPCTHLACKKCVLSWLCKSGGKGGCPLCRDPILPSNHSVQDLSDLVTFVDALPTNFAVVALVESQQVLTSPDVCNMCDDAPAKSYCLQCDIKLCKGCVKNHNKIPSLKKHTIEDLTKLTLNRLAETNRTMCKAHPDRLGELYCPAHKEVVCLLCVGTSHESCTGKQTVADAAKETKAELKARARTLRQSEGKLTNEIKKGKDVFKAVRKRVKDTFDHIQKMVEIRRKELEREIQAQEEATMPDRTSKETTRASLAFNANTLEQLVRTSPQAALLAMVGDLTSRLDQLQSHTATTTAGQLQVPEFTVDDSTLRQLKSDISSLGLITMTSPPASAKPKSSQTASPQSESSQLTSSKTASPQPTSLPQTTSTPQTMSSQQTTSTPQSTSLRRTSSQTSSSQKVRVTAASSKPGPKPRRAELARVLKVGDRVKPGPDWSSWTRRRGRHGRVTAIPSRLRAARGMNPSGWVDVLWDGEGEDCHQMGDGDDYELDLL